MTVTINGTSGIAGVDGSAGTPAIQGADTNTGVFFPAADTVAIGTGGSERMRVDSSGNVGIGVTPSASVKLQVKTATNQDLAVVSSSFVAGGVGLAGVNDAFSAYVPLDINGTSIQIGTGGTERMRIDSSGNLLIGCTSAPSTTVAGSGFVSESVGRKSLYLSSNASGATTDLIYLLNTSGTQGRVGTNATGSYYNTTSDYRLKENVEPMTGALAKVAALKPVTYKWKVNGYNGQGFIAHELAEVVPDCVAGEKDAVDADGNPDYQGIDTSFLVATLTAAIQEQQALITSLTARITALEAK
jgi:hypothetical protein